MVLRRRIRKAVELLHPEPNEVLLDVGCASGYYIEEAFLRRGVAQVIGLDISIEMLRKGRRKVLGLDYVCADAHLLPFRANTFDKVLCLDVLEHVHSDSRVIAEIFTTTREGGSTVMTIPNNILVLNFRDPSYFLWKLGSKPHKHYSREEVTQKLKKAGFSMIKMEGHGSVFYSLYLWIDGIQRRARIFPNFFLVLLESLADREFWSRPRAFGVTMFITAEKQIAPVVQSLSEEKR